MKYRKMNLLIWIHTVLCGVLLQLKFPNFYRNEEVLLLISYWVEKFKPIGIGTVRLF